MRLEFSDKTRALAFLRANGRCENPKCCAKLSFAKHEFDHDIPAAMGGDNSLTNCVVLCKSCHAAKTPKDVGNIAEAKRRQARHIGAHTSRNPLPCGKQSKWKKKMTGEVVLR